MNVLSELRAGMGPGGMKYTILVLLPSFVAVKTLSRSESGSVSSGTVKLNESISYRIENDHIPKILYCFPDRKGGVQTLLDRKMTTQSEH